MRHLRKTLLLFFLLNKRMLKKYSFLVILGMVPLLTAGMFLAAREEGGMLRIALCQEGGGDAASEKVIEELLERKSVFAYERAASVESAREAVRTGKADAAWIFSDGFEERVSTYVSDPGGREPLVRVAEREETVFLQLAREQLYSALYPHLSYALFKNYIALDLALEEGISPEELRAEYSTAEVKEGIFQFSYRDGAGETDKEDETNYLLTPLRGLLLLLVLLCGMAASLYFQQDRREGCFLRMSVGRGRLFPYLYHLTAVFDGAAAVLFTFYATRILLSWRREVLLMALYCAACVGFCNLFRKLCGTMQRLSACIPALVLAMVAVCPVFVSIGRFHRIRCLFPLFYYLQSLHNAHFIRYFLLYTAALYGADLSVKETGRG